MEDIFNLIEKIFPVIIFIFWVIVSVIASARKSKQRKQPSQTASQGTTSLEHKRDSDSSSDQDRTASSQTSRADDLKQKLESIFGDLTYEESAEEKKEPTTAENSVEKAPVESVPLLVKSNSVPRNYRTAHRSITIEEPLTDDVTSDIVTEISVSELRKAFIWSEIIAPPVALRKDAR
jgi:hypothetical protein